MKKLFNPKRLLVALAAAALVSAASLNAQVHDTEEVSMMKGVSKNIKNGWNVDPVFTVGETDNTGADYAQDRFNYRPPGVLDGMYAFRNAGRVNVYVNHELRDERGYPYTLANGTVLTGARVSKFVFRDLAGQRGVEAVSLAHPIIYDRYYQVVTDPAQLNEGENPGSQDGMDRLCSANGIERGKFGFMDDVFFTGEETDNGQEFALDTKNEILYCTPAMGRAAWESVCVMDNYGSNKVVVLVGDDRGGAPLLLYVGEKNQTVSNSASPFLIRNGLAKGNLYVWVADNGDRTPEDWNGTNTSRAGKFVKIEHYNPAMAGMPGYDADGWADMNTQDALAEAKGYFRFSRPEDVHTNPSNGSQAVMASTGLSNVFPSDSWGTTYLVDIDASAFASQLSAPLSAIDNIVAELSIMYDGDDSGAGQFSEPAAGLRSPDNLTWADNGYIYINEDRSVGGFCGDFISGNAGWEFPEASMWQLDPTSGDLTRILEIDRNAVPYQQFDSDQDDCGNWESSGTIDVTGLFQTDRNETLLLLNVQAHSNDDDIKSDSPIGGDDDLSEGGQLIFASKIIQPIAAANNSSNFRNNSVPVNTGMGGNDFRIYPNPAKDVLNFSEEATFRIYDVIGMLVMESEEASRSVSISNLNTGIYFFEAEGKPTLKFIVE